MYIGVLGTCLSAHLVHVWYPLRSEEGVRFSRTGLVGSPYWKPGKKENVREK